MIAKAQVDEIRVALLNGELVIDLARRYEVVPSSISRIKRAVVWNEGDVQPIHTSHYLKNHPEKIKHGSAHPIAKLTEDDVREIRRRRNQGETPADLGREYGVTSSAITCVTLRKSWKHIK